MAKAKTSSFTISEQITYTPGANPTSGAIAIGSLIDVGDAQALEVESVDWILQGYDTTNDDYEPIGPGVYAGACELSMQLTDKNTATLISAADNNMIASGNFNMDAGGNTSWAADFYPDDFGKGDGRFVVNDELYLLAKGIGNYDANRICKVTVRIRAKVVKLSARDWMAISLETVQNE